MRSSEKTGDYHLLDSGDGRKLERFGNIVLSRPCQAADWRKSLPQSEWDSADAAYSSDSDNEWIYNKSVPDSWVIQFDSISFKLSCTQTGQIGIFPEHVHVWDWVSQAINKSAKREISVLNLFAYTGGATLSASQAGAKVTHLDASKSVTRTARENAVLNQQEDAPIRWIVDDVMKFLNREVKRGNKYDAIILDPPSFGRGTAGEVFKIENSLERLLTLCCEVLTEYPLFFLLSCHSPNFTPLVLHDILFSELSDKRGRVSSGELVLPAEQGVRPIPSGAYALWSALRT